MGLMEGININLRSSMKLFNCLKRFQQQMHRFGKGESKVRYMMMVITIFLHFTFISAADCCYTEEQSESGGL